MPVRRGQKGKSESQAVAREWRVLGGLEFILRERKRERERVEKEKCSCMEIEV